MNGSAFAQNSAQRNRPCAERPAQRQRGQVLILMAVSMVAIFGTVAFVLGIDLAYLSAGCHKSGGI